MEERNEFDDILRNKMSVDHEEENLPASLVNEARTKVIARNKEIKSETFFTKLVAIFNYRIKLTHALTACAILGFTMFYLGRGGESKNENRGIQYAHTDTLESSSVKDNIFLVKNFTTRIN